MSVAQLEPDILALALDLAKANPRAMVGVFESATGTYLYVSPNHTQITGYHPHELVGQTLGHVVHPDDLEHTRLAFMDAVLHGQSIEVGVRLVHKDGHHLRVRATANHVVSGSGQDLMLGQAVPVGQDTH